MTDARALALKATEIGIVDEDLVSGSVYWSPTLYKILGVDPSVAPSLDAYFEVTFPHDRERVRAAIDEAKTRPADSDFTINHRILKDGRPRWISMRPHLFDAQSGERAEPRIIFSVVDITEWKRKEEATKHGETRLSAILSIVPSAIISIDSDQRITLFNEAARGLFGYSPQEIIGQPLDLLIPVKSRAAHRDNIQRFWKSPEYTRRMGERQDVSGLRKDGSEFPAEASISKIEIDGEKVFIVVLQDITERKKAAAQLAGMNRILEEKVAERTRELEVAMKRREEAQRQLIQAQRMEAFGQLTGGIAHDFNNLLAVIGGSLELLAPDIMDDAAREHLDRALNASEMGARLTSRLLTFARRGKLEPMTLNLNDQVRGLQELLRRTLGEQILLQTLLAGNLWLSRVDPSEAENAILNLALNARDAMPGGGRLLIETANVTIDQAQLSDFKGVQAGDYVRLSVSDTGIGIPPESLQRVFEPFFTTKGTGRGSGLGLSTVYGFATQSGGTVTIYSEVGRGTTINLYLPREIGAAAAKQAVAPNGEIVFSKENEMVLVVEDNPDVREITLQRVEGLGYVVLEAASGAEAIDVLSKEPGIALVFSDVVMAGGMSGYELVRWVRQNKPEIKVLLTSGFAPEIAGIEGDEWVPILRKPYNRLELSRALASALYEAGN